MSASFVGTCTTCHNTPNVGNHSTALPINIGVSDYPGRAGLDTSGLPVYTIQCGSAPPIQTTDPGRALITGKCADIGKMKGPILRGLASRPPYFHNGSAAALNDVLSFYEQRFGLKLSSQQEQDLIAFLNSL
jgi:cytochrome c peroxidase